GTTTLNWSTSNATACTASGAWSGTRATSGSAQSGALNASSTFVLTCAGPGGSASQSVSVSIAAAAPAATLNLSATPTTVESGGVSTIAWTSTGATGCTASGAWNGTRPTSGSFQSAAL